MLIPPILNLNNTRPGARPSCGSLDGGGVGRSNVDGVSADIADGLLLFLGSLDTVGSLGGLSLVTTLGDGLGLSRSGLLLLLSRLHSLAGLAEESSQLVGLGLGVGLGTVRLSRLLLLLSSKAAEHGGTALVLGGALGGLRRSSTIGSGGLLGLVLRLGLLLGLGLLLAILLYEAQKSTLGGRRSTSLGGLGRLTLGGGGDALWFNGLGGRGVNWVAKLGSGVGDRGVLVLSRNSGSRLLLGFLLSWAADLLEEVAENGSTLVLGGGGALRLGLGLFLLLLFRLGFGGLSNSYCTLVIVRSRWMNGIHTLSSGLCGSSLSWSSSLGGLLSCLGLLLSLRLLFLLVVLLLFSLLLLGEDVAEDAGPLAGLRAALLGFLWSLSLLLLLVLSRSSGFGLGLLFLGGLQLGALLGGRSSSSEHWWLGCFNISNYP